MLHRAFSRNPGTSQWHLNTKFKCMSTAATSRSLRRSFLYVPSSSERMLEKSINSGSDVIIYDLEDSVPPASKDKRNARTRLREFLERDDLPSHERIAVRVNDINTPFFKDDIAEIISNSAVRSLVLPKIHSSQDLDFVSNVVGETFQKSSRDVPLDIIPSIESARAMWNLGSIAEWKSAHGPKLGGIISALLFAAEDYCADTSIIRSPSRQELLYTRSRIVIAAKACQLDAIDMVCVAYKDLEVLKNECLEGRRLGFTAKQAIHPTQVDVIQSTFLPSRQEIIRAAKIVREMKEAHDLQKGAMGIDGEMIDAPMIKQAQKIIAIAEAAGLDLSSYQ